MVAGDVSVYLPSSSRLGRSRFWASRSECYVSDSDAPRYGRGNRRPADWGQQGSAESFRNNDDLLCERIYDLHVGLAKIPDVTGGNCFAVNQCSCCNQAVLSRHGVTRRAKVSE